jgi:hypothetical protein
MTLRLEFQADRVLVELSGDTMKGRPARWWTVLAVRDGRVVAIEDHARRRDAARALQRLPTDVAAA